jgi:hypothetical protein
LYAHKDRADLVTPPKELNIDATYTDLTDEQLESRIHSIVSSFGLTFGVPEGSRELTDETPPGALN